MVGQGRAGFDANINFMGEVMSTEGNLTNINVVLSAAFGGKKVALY